MSKSPRPPIDVAAKTVYTFPAKALAPPEVVSHIRDTIPLESMSNAKRRGAAHEHLDKMFTQAESAQIGGRRFFGKIRLTIPFVDGNAQDIQDYYKSTDRVNS